MKAYYNIFLSNDDFNLIMKTSACASILNNKVIVDLSDEENKKDAIEIIKDLLMDICSGCVYTFASSDNYNIFFMNESDRLEFLREIEDK